MKELYVFCEGQTEQGFCKQVLGPHLFPTHDGRVHTILIAHSRHRGIVHRGGIGSYATLRRDIVNKLKERTGGDVRFTTMFDLYKSPTDFPAKDVNTLDTNNPRSYVEALERAFGDDIGDRRFVPHLQLFEYETLLFSAPEGFRNSFENCDYAIKEMKRIVDGFSSVEHINDGEATAPSKRIIRLLPQYKGLKATVGPDIAEAIGLGEIRKQCLHFDSWLSRLESLWPDGP